MATKRPSLGRGLEALLGSVTPAHAPPPAAAVDARGTPTAQAPAPVAAAPRDEELARIPVDLLQRGPLPAAPRHAAREPAGTRRLDPRPGRRAADRGAAARRAEGRRADPLRDHRRRTSLACRADGGPARHPRRRPHRARRGRGRDVAHREHPAREPEPARGGPRARPADPRVRASPTSRLPMPSAARAPPSATCCACSSSPTK